MWCPILKMSVGCARPSYRGSLVYQRWAYSIVLACCQVLPVRLQWWSFLVSRVSLPVLLVKHPQRRVRFIARQV